MQHWWDEHDILTKYLHRNDAASEALVLHRRADHRQQSDGRSSRLGPHLQRPLPALQHHARLTASATRTASTARVSGSRSRSRKSLASTASTTSRTTASPTSSRSARSACCHYSADPGGAIHPPRRVDGLGRLVLHHVGREQLHDLGLSQAVLAERGGSTAATTSCPGAHAAPPASPTWRSTRGARKVQHTSVYVRLPLVDRPDEYLLVWTTTPWTLPANVAAAVNPGTRRMPRSSRTAPTITSRADVVPKLKKLQGHEHGEAKVVGTIKGSEPARLALHRPLRRAARLAERGGEHRVIAWDEVSAAEGTGIVHIAPGCGREDFALAKESRQLVILAPVDENGVYVDGLRLADGDAGV